MKKLPPFELIVWIVVITYLGFLNPYQETTSLCAFGWLGLTWCPGCGIGHSISFALHGNISASFESHYLGIIALIILLHRIFILSKQYYQNLTLNNPTHGQEPTDDVT
ncbi:MAG: DUF2752 domain-containing protein [Bacteroidia bacterium]|nr:DUF2752 domain-containing protein [Bacteroidia bacterium]HQV00636.1 DUF2752 domain-containing protein [Bacteroidia bacterium]